MSLDPRLHTAAVVIGFGPVAIGAARLLGRKGLTICYEPDAERVRVALADKDFIKVRAAAHFAFIADDARTHYDITVAYQGHEIVSMLGCKLLEETGAVERIGAERVGAFLDSLLRVYSHNAVAAGTNSHNGHIFFGNEVANLAAYAAAGAVSELVGTRKGVPAICVAAGPSLDRNLRLLTDYSLRDRFVIVAVQTVIRTLLRHDIRPHYVTALDYSPLSGRFYEGLAEPLVRGTELVVKASASPAIFKGWPGKVRCAQSLVCDVLMGGTPRSMGDVPARGTVAHMSYVLARMLGCDPVVLVGQDLAFTGGKYYADEVARDLWGEALKATPLHTLQRERVDRVGKQLTEAKGHNGETIQTDPQMTTYLGMFETSIATDNARGLTTIDATEGGVPKKGARNMQLADVLAAYGLREAA